MVKVWSKKKKATKRQLLSIQGRLIWVSRVVRYGRLFVQRIISEGKKVDSLDSWLTISDECRRDLEWWKSFLMTYNGVSYIPANKVAAHLLGVACTVGWIDWVIFFQNSKKKFGTFTFLCKIEF